MRHRLPRSARLALTTVKIALVVMIGVLGWATQSLADGPSETSGGYAGLAVHDQASHVAKVLHRHQCSVSGFADGSQPVSAVVRSASGHLRFVPFETGWRVFSSHGAASLVAVCLDAAPQAP